MAEHTSKLRTNRSITPINLVSDNALSFSLGLAQDDVVKVVSNPLQSRKIVSTKEIRSKFRNDPVKMANILKKKTVEENSFSKTIKNKKNEKKSKAEEITESSNVDDDVENSSTSESEEDIEEKILWDYGMRKQEAKAQSDDEVPLRPVRESKITSVTKILDV
ncbi:hypothetical protein FXO38_00233 [Capsicum annuum]|nr:hypothetical protein FXO38_00233 [Capsicum annuum]